MRAGRPTTRKIRARPAWISPAVRVPAGRQGAGQDLSRAVDWQRFDLLARHPRAVLAGPSATPRLRRPWNRVEREIPADPADHRVAGREDAFDQPSAHEPGIKQDAHPAEPVAEQTQQDAGALELA